MSIKRYPEEFKIEAVKQVVERGKPEIFGPLSLLRFSVSNSFVLSPGPATKWTIGSDQIKLLAMKMECHYPCL